MNKLFQYNCVCINVRWPFVMFKIFLNHLICYISGAPNSVTNSPKMSTPILFTDMRKFFLDTSRGSSFQSLYNITHTFARWIFDMKMNMICAYNSRQYCNIFCFTYLFYQRPTSYFNFSLQHFKSVLRHPYYVTAKTRYSMTAIPLFILHRTNIQKCVATESLALKRIVFTNELKQ